MNRTLPTLGIAAIIVAATFSPRRAAAQAVTGRIAGVVRARTGEPLSLGKVYVDSLERRIDSLGRFTFERVRAGRTRLRVAMLFYPTLDTTITVRAGATTRFVVKLAESKLLKEMRDEESERLKEQRVADSLNAIAGSVDSVALGLLHLKPLDSGSLTFAAFGARLLAAAVRVRGADSNTVLSPLSAGLALSLPLLGARGATASALASMLGTDSLDRSALDQRGAALMTAMNGRTDVQLEIANAVWTDTSTRLVPEFSASAAHWGASSGRMPLSSQLALDSINAWTNSATHGRIQHLLEERLSDSTVLFIANAAYFKGRWLQPFGTLRTRPRAFHLQSGEVIQAPFMAKLESLAYERADGYQMVRLPYRTGKTAMYVILPDSGRIDALQQRFGAQGWPTPTSRAAAQMVRLVLPKFHVEQSIDLVPLLRLLGAGITLDCEHADFSGLAEVQVPDSSRICIQRAMQKVYLDVDEEGTEAVAVTAVEAVIAELAPPPPISFIVDRPFFFMLRDEVTGANLFVGRIGRP